jgi:hypothetical protein
MKGKLIIKVLKGFIVGTMQELKNKQEEVDSYKRELMRM